MRAKGKQEVHQTREAASGGGHRRHRTPPAALVACPGATAITRGRGFVDGANTPERDQRRGNRERRRTGAAEKLPLVFMSTERLPALHLFCARRTRLAVGSAGRLGSMEGGGGGGTWAWTLRISLIFFYIKVYDSNTSITKNGERKVTKTLKEKARGTAQENKKNNYVSLRP